MQQAIIKIELEMTVDVDDSTTIEEAQQIALFECEAESSIHNSILDKMEDRDVVSYEVLNAEFADM